LLSIEMIGVRAIQEDPVLYCQSVKLTGAEPEKREFRRRFSVLEQFEGAACTFGLP
jgi:hypothetical protein